MKKKGISLIVLVITIVVIIILAAAVILSLGKNNPINSAKEAKVKTTIDNLKSDLIMSVSKITANSLGQVAVTDIDAPGKYEITELIPSIKGTEYENELVVVDGKIQVKAKSSLPIETQVDINNVLGQSINASVVKSNPDAYYGKTINFKDGQNFNNWKLFYADNTNIYLIAGDYVPLNMITENLFKKGYVNPEYCAFLDETRTEIISKFLNENNFTQLKDENGKAISVVGGPTLQQFVESYNAVSHPINKVQKIYFSGDDTNGYNIKGDGEPVATNSPYVSNIDIKDGLYAINSEEILKVYWLPSACVSTSNNNIFCMSKAGGMFGGWKYNDVGIRPVVKLNSNVSLVDAGNGTFNLE